MQTNPFREKIKVLLADDHPSVLLGVKAYLSTQKHIEIVGEATSGESAVELSRELSPDIAIIDIGMPGMSGIEATFIIKEQIPGIKIIIFSMHDDREYVLQFLRCGASAYVLKKSSPEELLCAIECVMKKGAYFSPPIAEMLLKEHQTGFTMKPEMKLTPREEQVLRHVARGKSSKQIAPLLHVQERTITKHRQHLMEKLNIHTVAELTQYAISKKLIELDRR